MGDPHWAGYVGMVTGIIGAITGIAGAIMGYVSYRRSNSIKKLDLRLELRKAIYEAKTSLSKLDGLLDYANQSRQRVAAATGRFGSGAMKIWNNAFDEDKNRLKQLAEDASAFGANYDDLSFIELESQLVNVHKLQGQIAELTEKYESSIKSDDEERRQIREDVRSRTAPRSG
jgi:hypothetical protein